MEPDRWRRVEAIFYEALDVATSERTAHVRATCGEDAELQLEVESLLASMVGAAESMRTAIADAAAALATTGVASLLGKRVGAYRLVEVIGQGGMGTVYLARRDDAQFEQEAAIKILPLGLATPEAIARFRDERQMLATLDHPSIVRLVDGGTTDDGVPYLVMEHVDGVPLTAYTRDLPLRAKIELVVHVGAALQYAHQHLIIHRDIKPGNILVDASGTPKLLDFGIAKLLDHEPGAREARTRTGIALLTPEYASPEQARGGLVTVASDVYSLGAVLYEVLAGKPPLPATGGAFEVLRRICEDDPPRPSAAGGQRELAGDLDNIVMKALHKRADQRYASVAQLVEDLDRFLRGLPVSAREATWRYRALKFIRRNRGKLAMSAAIAVTLMATTIISIREARRADGETERARSENVALLSERGWEELVNGHPGRALPFLVEALRSHDSGALRFSIAEATRTFEQQVARIDVPDGITGATLSPDGTRLAVTGLDDVLRVIDAATGETRFQQRGPWHQLEEPTYSHDGRHLFASGSNAEIYDWTLATGATRLLRTATPPYGTGKTMVVTPDDSRLVSNQQNGHVVIWDLATGAPIRDLSVSVPRPAKGVFCGIAANDQLAVVAEPGQKLQLLDVRTGETLPPLVGAPVGCHAIRLSRAGQLFIAADTSVEIWNTARGQKVADIPQGDVDTLELDASEDKLATRPHALSPVRIWNVRDATLVSELIGHRDGVISMRFSPDDRMIVTAGYDSTYRVWDVASGAEDLVIEGTVAGGTARGSMGGLLCAWVSGDDTRLVTAAARDIRLWRLDQMWQRRALHLGWFALGIALSPDDRDVAVAGRDRLEIWRFAEGRKLHAIELTNLQLWDADWSADEIVAAGDGGIARIYDRELHLVRSLDGHTGRVNRSVWSPDGARVATASDDRTARIWDATTGTMIARLPHPERVMSVSWSHDGKRVVTTGWDGQLRIWNPASGELLLAFSVPGVGLLDAQFSPNGRRLASTGHGGELDVWDASTGRHELSLVGHSNPVASVAWNPEGDLLASTSSDHSVRIWDAETGKQLAIHREDGEVMEVVWAHAAARFFTISVAGAVSAWDVARDARSIDALSKLVRDHVPYRLENGRLQLESPERDDPH